MLSEQFAARPAELAFALSIGCATVLLLAEAWRPLTGLQHSLGRRWFANLSLLLASAVIQRGLASLALFSLAVLAAERGWGLFHRLDTPIPLVIAASILAIDLAGYAVHRLEHRFPVLWRIHRLHHSDPDVDVTTSYRFHPFEVALRSVAKGAVVVAIGAPPVAVGGYIVSSAVVSVLSHANLRLPRVLDRAIGLVALTPEMHRTHHSIDAADSNANFGVCLSLWDRLFQTYRACPRYGHERMVFGVAGRSAGEATSILRMLADPFLPEGPGAACDQPGSDQAGQITVSRGA